MCALFGNLCMLSFASFSSNGNSNASPYQGLGRNKFHDIHVEINEGQPNKNKQRLFTLRSLKEGTQTPSPGLTGDSDAGRRVQSLIVEKGSVLCLPWLAGGCLMRSGHPLWRGEHSSVSQLEAKVENREADSFEFWPLGLIATEMTVWVSDLIASNCGSVLHSYIRSGPGLFVCCLSPEICIVNYSAPYQPIVKSACAMCAQLLQSMPALRPYRLQPARFPIHGILQAKSWSGWPCLSSGDLPDPGNQTVSLMPPALTGGFFTTNTT